MSPTIPNIAVSPFSGIKLGHILLAAGVLGSLYFLSKGKPVVAAAVIAAPFAIAFAFAA